MFVSLVSFGLGGCDKVTNHSNQHAEDTAPISDLDIATNVKNALLKDDTVKAFDITVIVSNGDVRLTGVVNNTAQLEQALRLARSTEGVRAVHNELKIKESEQG